jgi:hypothetical protein
VFALSGLLNIPFKFSRMFIKFFTQREIPNYLQISHSS